MRRVAGGKSQGSADYGTRDRICHTALPARRPVHARCGTTDARDAATRLTRNTEYLADREISVGDYVLSGGELPAALIVDAVSRLLPGALGNENSARQESFTGAGANQAQAPPGKNSNGARGTPDSTCGSGGLLDYPQYTRPADFRGMKVPEELVSGNHDEIRRWRRQRALEKTFHHRPGLLVRAELSVEDEKFLQKLRREAAS